MSRRGKILLMAGLAALLLVLASGVGWWRLMSVLSRRTASSFHLAVEEAVRDSVLRGTDIEVEQQLVALSTVEGASLLARDLAIGVGLSPLLLGSVTPEDREDMIAVRDFLAPSRGRVSFRQMGEFMRANPRVQRTFQSFRSAVRSGANRCTGRPSRAI
jgi:hypothetical protein